MDSISKDFDILNFQYCDMTFQIKARLIKMGILNSLNIFLRQEIDRMQKVITLVRSTLTDLQLAIEGTIIMSEVCALSTIGN